jgi:hypothetical protein
VSVLPVVVFPDTLLWLSGYLRTALVARGYGDDLLVGTKYERHESVVWLRSDGGPRLDITRQVVRLGINVFADGPTGKPVNDLAALVSALVTACPDGNPVVRATCSGPAQIDDPNGQPCRYLTGELIVRGSNQP